MPRSDGRIEPGQKLTSAISARAWNRAQQAADIVLGSTTGTAATTKPPVSSPYTWVYCRNSTGGNVDRWSVLEVTGVEVTPTTTITDAETRQFQSMPVLTGGAASSSTTRWCVATEPIADGKIGRVAVAGAVQIHASDLTKVGGAKVLWEDANWALVIAGSGGGDPVRLGKTTSAWSKNTTATIDLYEQGTPPSETRNPSPYTLADCVNKFANVGSGKWVMVAKMTNGRWYLIAAEC